MEKKIHGGIELGGTKTICAIGDTNGSIGAQITIPTTTVSETFSKIFDFFEKNQKIISLGVGSFGPLQINNNSQQYGHIYNSPKNGWENVKVKDMLEKKLQLPICIDTDVNCAALGELYYGAAKNVNNFIYLTLGTGIGGSLVADRKLVHGILNLEMGHMRIPHENFSGSFKGSCVFHNDCFEGIASGNAMRMRYGENAEDINDDEIWEREADYVASAVNNLMLTFGPELIVIGGGLTKQEKLLPDVRRAAYKKINKYMDFPEPESYIVKSSSDANGVLGAIKIAAEKHSSS